MSELSSDPIQFLIDQINVDYLPSASMLSATQESRSPHVLIAVADEGNERLQLPPLRAADDETKSITAAHGADHITKISGKGFTVETLRTRLASRPGVLHLVGHLVFDPTHGPLFVLPLISNEPSFLGAEQIVTMTPTPPLVLLSACETGEGELVGGEGILGLVRAFQLSGSQDVVASLWQVDDQHSAELMGAFHRELSAGSSTREALANAARTQRTGGFLHPFYWGAFVLYGAR